MNINASLAANITLPTFENDMVLVTRYLHQMGLRAQHGRNGVGIDSTSFTIDKPLVEQLMRSCKHSTHSAQEVMSGIVRCFLEKSAVPGSSWNGLEIPYASLSQNPDTYTITVLGTHARFPVGGVLRHVETTCGKAARIEAERIIQPATISRQ